MRDATKEERESIDNYIKSISYKVDDEIDLPIKHESKPYLMIPLPDGATNGDMIKALLKTTIRDTNCAFMWIDCGEGFCPAKFDIDWWNASYKKEGNKE